MNLTSDMRGRAIELIQLTSRHMFPHAAFNQDVVDVTLAAKLEAELEKYADYDFELGRQEGHQQGYDAGYSEGCRERSAT